MPVSEESKPFYDNIEREITAGCGMRPYQEGYRLEFSCIETEACKQVRLDTIPYDEELDFVVVALQSQCPLLRKQIKS